MRTIGLVGGTGWISTLEYYRIMNETVNRRLGGLQSARCILYSFNYGDIDRLNQQDDLPGVLSLVVDAARRLAGAGADCILLCANTLHLFAGEVEKQIALPLLHIADATARAVKDKGLSRVGLLGTRYTMERDFYRKKLNQANIEVLVPDKVEREFIHQAIMTELLKEIIRHDTKSRFMEIINKLAASGAEGIVLGCTEIPLLIGPADTHLPVFNTTVIHALAAVEFALDIEE